MLNRLRRKFILVAMGSLLVVLSVFLLLLNAGNYLITTAAADQLLVSISNNQGELPSSGDGPGQMPWDYPITEETPYETRYFVVRADQDQSVVEVQLDFISAVSGADAHSYFQRAMASGRAFGYLDSYRFYHCEQEGGSLFIFLDCANQLRGLRNVLLISLGGSLLVFSGTGVLVLLLSRRAIRPMLLNLDRQRQFITDASHELRTPLTAILAACDLMDMDDPDNEWLHTVRQEGQRMGRLVTELVTLSRMDEADPFPHRQVFSLSRAAWDIADSFLPVAQARGKRLELDIQDGVLLYGEEAAIQRVISILLDNAVKYSVGTEPIRFTLSRRRREILLDTVNHSLPLAPEQTKRLFDRFYRADPSRTRSTGGSGIGLAMARAIVEAHGGQIRAWCSGAERAVIHFQVRLHAAPDKSRHSRTALVQKPQRT